MTSLVTISAFASACRSAISRTSTASEFATPLNTKSTTTPSATPTITRESIPQPTQTATVTPHPIPSVVPQIFVDSRYGSDRNDGTSPSTAFATISRALKIIESHTIIGLLRGSHFREQLASDKDGLTVVAVGTGSKPILDCSDIISKQQFLNTSGLTNVYEVQLEPDLHHTKSWINVWENDRNLVRAESIQGCEETPGSYYPSADIGNSPIILYIHPYDSSSPITNNSIYEYSARQFGIRLADNAQLIGIETRRNLHKDGSTKVGRFSLLQDCLFRDGSIHNVYFKDGSKLIDCQSIDAYSGDQSAAMYVLNDGIPQRNGAELINCNAISTTVDLNTDGFFSHRNVDGSFGKVSYIRCIAQNLNTGFSNSRDADEVVYDSCQSIDNKLGFRVGVSPVTSLINCSHTGDQRAIMIRNGKTKTIIKGFACFMFGIKGSTIFSQDSGVEVRVSESFFRVSNFGSNSQSTVIHLTGDASQLSSFNNSFNGFTTSIYKLPADIDLSSDSNCFAPFSTVSIGNKTYTEFDQYRRSTSQDTNSSSGICSKTNNPND